VHEAFADSNLAFLMALLYFGLISLESLLAPQAVPTAVSFLTGQPEFFRPSKTYVVTFMWHRIG
jgi:hypothetical protein